MYDYDSNSILTETMKTREVKSMNNSYKKLYNSLATKGLKSRFQKLNNKYSNISIESLQYKITGFQLVL